MFGKYSKNIQLLFPKESRNTYYIKYQKQGLSRKFFKGKLIHHYNYKKKCYKEKLILAQRKNPPVEHLEISGKQVLNKKNYCRFS